MNQLLLQSYNLMFKVLATISLHWVRNAARPLTTSPFYATTSDTKIGAKQGQV
jgi:hypothetical protein